MVKEPPPSENVDENEPEFVVNESEFVVKEVGGVPNVEVGLDDF